MHLHMTPYEWWLVGRYSAVALLGGAGWLSRQRWLPHRHDGYVSMNGYVHACGRCGRLPAGAYRTGFGGTIGPDGYDSEGYDKDGFNRDGLNRAGHDRAYVTDYADAIERAFRLGYNPHGADDREDGYQ